MEKPPEHQSILRGYLTATIIGLKVWRDAIGDPEWTPVFDQQIQQAEKSLVEYDRKSDDIRKDLAGRMTLMTVLGTVRGQAFEEALKRTVENQMEELAVKLAPSLNSPFNVGDSIVITKDTMESWKVEVKRQ